MLGVSGFTPVGDRGSCDLGVLAACGLARGLRASHFPAAVVFPFPWPLIGAEACWRRGLEVGRSAPRPPLRLGHSGMPSVGVCVCIESQLSRGSLEAGMPEHRQQEQEMDGGFGELAWRVVSLPSCILAVGPSGSLGRNAVPSAFFFFFFSPPLL